MVKKLLIIAVMVFACGTLHAQEDILFQDLWLNDAFKDDATELPEIGMDHGWGDDVTPTPIGDGIVLLIGLGAAYALKNRRKNE